MQNVRIVRHDDKRAAVQPLDDHRRVSKLPTTPFRKGSLLPKRTMRQLKIAAIIYERQLVQRVTGMLWQRRARNEALKAERFEYAVRITPALTNRPEQIRVKIVD